MVESDKIDTELATLYEKVKRLTADRNKAENLVHELRQERDAYRQRWLEAQAKLDNLRYLP